MLSGLPLDGEHALRLAPLAVRPNRQRRGIGSALVEAGRPQWAFQAIALADDHPRGRATYPPAFDIVA
jgi:GNAT superfamily N-acetyltransferase